MEVHQELQLLFPGFNRLLLDELSSIGRITSFSDDEVIMRPGQYMRSAIIVMEGSIRLYREGEDGGEFFLYYLGPGEACALSMICALRQETSGLKAQAVGAVRALTIPIDHMDHLMRTHREWMDFVLLSYRSRFEEVLSLLDQVVFKSMDEKLEFYLDRQFRIMGDRLEVTHQRIANDLNSSREVISRLLKKMENQGLVHIHRNEIVRGNLGKR